MKNIWFLTFVLFLLFGCNNEELGSNYYYLSADEALDIGYPYGSIIYKSPEKKLFRDIIVSADVIDCKYDDRYILVSQQTNKNIMKQSIKDELSTWDEYYKNSNKDSLVKTIAGSYTLKKIHEINLRNPGVYLDKKIDSMLENIRPLKILFKNPLNYYIIDKVNTVDYGPLNKYQFDSIRITKNIQLQLK